MLKGLGCNLAWEALGAKENTKRVTRNDPNPNFTLTPMSTVERLAGSAGSGERSPASTCPQVFQSRTAPHALVTEIVDHNPRGIRLPILKSIRRRVPDVVPMSNNRIKIWRWSTPRFPPHVAAATSPIVSRCPVFDADARAERRVVKFATSRAKMFVGRGTVRRRGCRCRPKNRPTFARSTFA